MDDTPLEKLIANICDTSDLTDAEVREELAADGVDVDAAKARTMAKVDALLAARAVRLAIAAVKANPIGGLMHINAAVKAVPLLIAEVERLQAALAAARVAVEELPRYEAQMCDIEYLGASDLGNANESLDRARRALGLEVGNG